MIELLHAKAISELESELRKPLILLQKFCYKSKNHQAINLLARSFLGMHQITSGIYQKGIETLLNILEEIDYLTDTKWSPCLRETKGDILEKIAFYRMSQRNYKESIRLYDEAINLNKELGLIYKNVMSLANQGIVFRRTGHYEQSINVLEEAKSEIFKISNGSLNSWTDFTLSYVEHHLAYVFLDQNKLESAEHLCIKVLEKNKSMKNDWGVADCYDQLGLIFLRRQKLKGAENYFRKSLSIRKMIGNPHSIVSSVFHLAALYRAKGEILKSVIYIMQGLNMYRRLGLFNFNKSLIVLEGFQQRASFKLEKKTTLHSPTSFS
jgi:tetratricopeptide (TPR) repeat protein